MLDNESARMRRFDARPEAPPEKQKPVDHTPQQIKPVTRLTKSYWHGYACTPHHDQVYPLPADLDFRKYIVGVM